VSQRNKNDAIDLLQIVSREIDALQLHVEDESVTFESFQLIIPDDSKFFQCREGLQVCFVNRFQLSSFDVDPFNRVEDFRNSRRKEMNFHLIPNHQTFDSFVAFIIFTHAFNHFCGSLDFEILHDATNRLSIVDVTKPFGLEFALDLYGAHCNDEQDEQRNKSATKLSNEKQHNYLNNCKNSFTNYNLIFTC